ncbi:CHAP domain-containing protein [Nonomuraea sp. NPDC004354]
MDPIAEGLLKAARPELGYREKGGQYTKFGTWYADLVQDPQYRNAPWCDMFITWAAHKAGLQEYVGQFAWTPSHAAWFIQQGAWSPKPEPGALVFYDWRGGKSYKGIDHVGIVEKVAGSKIHTIEANVDKVWLKRKIRDTDKVVGYGLPRLVKEHPTLIEVRPSDQPLEPFSVQAHVPPAMTRESPFDVLGTPQALLAAMVLTTVVVSFRMAGRSRGSGRHRRELIPWVSPDPAPPPHVTAARTTPAPPPHVTAARLTPSLHGPVPALPPQARTTTPAPPGVPRTRVPADEARSRAQAERAHLPLERSGERAPAAPVAAHPLTPPGGTARRRRPYETATGK